MKLKNYLTLAFLFLTLSHGTTLAQDEMPGDRIRRGATRVRATGTNVDVTVPSGGALRVNGIPVETSGGVASVDLKSFGAVGDDTANDSPALQNALNAIAALNSPTTKLIVPAGTYKLSTAVSKSFTALRSDIIIEGVGSGSVFHIASGASTTNLTLQDGSSLVMRGLTFVGTNGTLTDAQTAVRLTGFEQTKLENISFYGVSNAQAGGQVLEIRRTDLKADNVRFEGSATYGFVGSPTVLIEEWSGVDWQGFRFIDYGVLNNVLYSKTPTVGSSAAWIKLGNSYNQSDSQGLAHFRNGFMDEGANIGIWSIQTQYNAIVTVDGLGQNINNTDVGEGVVFSGTKVARLLNSKHGLASGSPRVIVRFQGVEHAEVSGIIGSQQSKIIVADSAVSSITVKNVTAYQLSSAATSTKIYDSTISVYDVTGQHVERYTGGRISIGAPTLGLNDTTQLRGGVNIIGFPAVTGLTASVLNGGNGGTRTYWIAAVDVGGRRTLLSSPLVVNNGWSIGNLSVPSNSGHEIYWAKVPGAVSYDILRDFTSRKVVNTVGTPTNADPNTLYYVDRSEAYTAYTPPTTNETASLTIEGVPVVAGSTAAPCLVYEALLTQTDTNAPVATVLRNTLGGTVVWTRDGAGDYTATLAGAFTVDKVVAYTQVNDSGAGDAIHNISVTANASANSISISTRYMDSSPFALKMDGILNKTPINVCVYPN